jgi:hypothetical protein
MDSAEAPLFAQGASVDTDFSLLRVLSGTLGATADSQTRGAQVVSRNSEKSNIV